METTNDRKDVITAAVEEEDEVCLLLLLLWIFWYFFLKVTRWNTTKTIEKPIAMEDTAKR